MSDGQRRTVLSTPRYEEAARAVDWLSDEGFPVEHVVIVGVGLRSVERVSGRMTVGRAALIGAGQGALIGLLFALLFGIFFAGPDFGGLLAYAIVAGAIFGALFAALGQAALGSGRSFASVTGSQAERYEVQVADELAAEAERILARQPARAAPAGGA